MDISRNESKDPVDSAIFKVLSRGPVSHGNLMKEVLNLTRESQSQFNKRLAVLRDDTRQVLSVRSGRHTYYGLPEQKDQLTRLLKKNGELEQYVIDSARALRDYMMNKAVYDWNTPGLNSSIHARFIMFWDAVDRLRESCPGLPAFKQPKKEPSDQQEYLNAIRLYHLYTLEILDFLEQ
jgi:hypothetical protein